MLDPAEIKNARACTITSAQLPFRPQAEFDDPIKDDIEGVTE